MSDYVVIHISILSISYLNTFSTNYCGVPNLHISFMYCTIHYKLSFDIYYIFINIFNYNNLQN